MTASDTIAADASGLRIAVLVSRYHVAITEALEEGARNAFTSAGGAPGDLEIFDCPGAFELAGLASVAMETGRFDAVVCLGCVIRGETSHDEWINSAVANELAAMIRSEVAIASFTGKRIRTTRADTTRTPPPMARNPVRRPSPSAVMIRRF